ncbi:MAG: glycosyltransferase family 4 protein [Lentisphaeria bacterium]|nr:glycosyltransferase family 4 protein [Lentisphaeria bacterium]
MKILVLANHYNTLRIFRRELLQALSAAGHEVIVSIPPCDEENRKLLESYGTRVIFTAFERRGRNPFADLKLLEEYKKLIKAEKPDKVITYTIKCNIYGATACKKYRVPCYVNVTGLGSTFQGQGLMRKLVSTMYKMSLNKAEKVFFENEGNRNTLVNDGIVRAEQTVVMPGAGVNLTEFAPVPYPEDDGVIRFLFVGRIMREKGVDEYFSAIKRIRKEYPNTEFDFIGWYEDNYEEQVKQLEEQGYIRFHGFQADVKPFIEAAHCSVLPSWHEGMSNTLLESAAMCRPLITSNIHGCKEAVEDGVNGYLVEVKNEESLYQAMIRFIRLSYDEKRVMGQIGRKIMESRFDKRDVVKKTIILINDQNNLYKVSINEAQ